MTDHPANASSPCSREGRAGGQGPWASRSWRQGCMGHCGSAWSPSVRGVVSPVLPSPVTVCLGEGEEGLIPPSSWVLQHLLGESQACGLRGSQPSPPEVPVPHCLCGPVGLLSPSSPSPRKHPASTLLKTRHAGPSLIGPFETGPSRDGTVSTHRAFLLRLGNY
ncbi:hypothetical protein HJG60_011069 [Phyllostomus discolor]|uniref:Uncharacterized protein n=1 Tax=Phyllostomus discolor TaxID=89673 RepID=A0A834A878_9CHIR|nr:hypothetical protein HJG60_011069 [Phyllostomus discolor]